jgi:hypothetical protein
MGGSILQPNQTLEESERFLYKINFYKRIQQRINDLKQQTDNFTNEVFFISLILNVYMLMYISLFKRTFILMIGTSNK